MSLESLIAFFISIKKYFFVCLNAKILLAFIFLIFLYFINKYVVPFFKKEFLNSTNKIKLVICKYEQLLIYNKLISVLTGSLILLFLKKINLAIIKINHFYLCNYVNLYFYMINLILLNIYNDFNGLLKVKINTFNLNFFKNSLFNFFISYKLIF